MRGDDDHDHDVDDELLMQLCVGRQCFSRAQLCVYIARALLTRIDSSIADHVDGVTQHHIDDVTL